MFGLPLRVIAKTKLSGAAASTTFTLADYTIPAGTRHLVVIYSARIADATSYQNFYLRFNGDAGTNYNGQIFDGAGAAASAFRRTGTASMEGGQASGDLAAASLFGCGMIVIPHYANTANHKVALQQSGASELIVEAGCLRWASIAAITSISVVGASNFLTNSIFLLCAVDERYLVEEKNLSGDATVTFSTIPQTPGDLVVVGFCRGDAAATSINFRATINDDATDANYGRQLLSGSGTTASASAGADRLVGSTTGDSATANAFGAFVQSISQHANGVKQPHLLTVSGYHEGSGPDFLIRIASSRRANVAAYTKIAYTPTSGTNFKSGSLFSLYHVPKRLVAYKKLTADAPSITHTVPAGYEALVETVFARSDRAAATDGADVAFNNDTTAANYDRQYLIGDGSTVSAAQSSAARNFIEIPAASATANVFGGGVVLIPAYAETDRHKHVLGIHGPSDDSVLLDSDRWENTAAITEIDMTPVTGPNFEGN